MKKLFLLLTALTLLWTSKLQAQTLNKTDYRGVNLVLETGGFVGRKSFDMRGFSPLTILGGYTFNKHWFVGGGVGINYYNSYKTTIVPIFARTKWSVLKSKYTPYLSVDLGYNVIASYPPKYEMAEGGTIPNHTKMKMGFYGRTEVGVSIRLKGLKAIHFGVGYMVNSGGYEKRYVKDGDMIVEDGEFLGAATFRVGFTF